MVRPQLLRRHLADDLPINLAKMSLWTYEEASAYFESGGTVVPQDTPTLSPQEVVMAPPPAKLGRKARIALLHGTANNQTTLKMSIGRLSALLRDKCELFYIEGNLMIDESYQGPARAQAEIVRQTFGNSMKLFEYAPASEDARGWRTYQQPQLDEALEYIERQIAALPGGGGVDALLGFSQGANLITMLVPTFARHTTSAPLRCVVMLSPSLPGWAADKAALFNAPLTTPALLAYSETDTTALGRQEVAKLWAPQSIRTLVHTGPGHRPLPQAKDELQATVQTIADFILHWCPQ